MSSVFTIDRIQRNNKTVEFNPAITVRMDCEDGVSMCYVLDIPGLSDIADNEGDIQEFFWMLWDVYAMSDPDDLTPRAKKIWELLRSRGSALA